jgi:hypothetical protein
MVAADVRRRNLQRIKTLPPPHVGGYESICENLRHLRTSRFVFKLDTGPAFRFALPDFDSL